MARSTSTLDATRRQVASSVETVPEQLKRLAAEEADSWKRCLQLDKEQKKPWKVEIKILAEIIEKEYILEGKSEQINTISAIIAKRFRENGLSVWQNVPHLIPSKYKDSKHDNSLYQYSETKSGNGTAVLIQEAKQVSQNIEQIPDEQLGDWFTIGKRLSQGCKKRADARNVAIPPDEYGNEQSKQSEKIKTDLPRPHGSLLHDAVAITIKIFEKLHKQIFKFPPEILNRDEELSEGVKTFNKLFDTALDLKYSQSWIEWFRTEKYRDLYGKHAAAVMSFSLSNLCANCSDESTKEWVRMEPIFSKQYETYSCLQCGYQQDTVCPRCNLAMKHLEKSVISWQCSECEGTIPLSRDLTREQVGDKSSIVVDAAEQVLDHLPILVAFFAWYAEWIKPRVGGRKIRLGPDLSEKA